MGELRIVAGSLRRRKIKVPPGSSVRPTSDRVREALFGILGSSLEGAVVLDAFAGSGALGLEALSRGAVAVTFVERDREAVAVLRDNIRALGVLEPCRVLHANAEDALARGAAGGPYDLVLADPPYDAQLVERFLRRLVASRVLAERARVVVERDHRTPAVTVGTFLTLERTVRHGRTCLDLYRGSVPDPRPEPIPTADSGTDPGGG